ncbi:hypothetical protein HID58_024653 [Brassica napus]|uniref:60S ribosomal protein L31 n=1 Tax=Brassica napus TaxID=3708 RepID=A0ABQ8CIT6_BRANA|nr:hypothetical protein HID58_024653 [Brassica napus]
MNPMRAKQLVVGPPSKKRRRHRSEFVAVVTGLELGGSMVVLSSEVLILLSGDVLKLLKQLWFLFFFWKANVRITQMAKEASSGGGGEAEQEEEERWRKRDDKDTKGRRGCGEDVRVDVKLNKQIWSRGIRGPPRRVRVYVACKRNDDEDAKEEFYSLVTVAEIPAEGLSGLGTKVIDEDE